MKTSEIIQEIERLAPLSLSQAYVKQKNGYDNSGLLILGEEEEHSKIYVCMDVLASDIEFCRENDIKFIFCHHPYIYGKIGSVSLATPRGGEIISAVRAGITIYSAHLNMDIAKGGIDDTLAGLFGGEIVDVCHEIEAGDVIGGYGKITQLGKKEDSGEFFEKLSGCFGVCKRVMTCDVQRVASFCGSGLSEAEFEYGILQGVDTFVSSDLPHHMLVEAKRLGVNMFDVPHGDSEYFCFKRCIKKMNFEGVKLFFAEMSGFVQE